MAMYQPYADNTYYTEVYKGTEIDKNEIDKYLKKASREIDALTFNRIVKKGFNNLSEYQKEIIKEVCCEHASFLYDNEDMLKTYLSSYAINGVNMTFGGSWNIHIEEGIAIDKRLYEQLCSTGLCCRSFYYG
jgi:hypothetical protein